MSAIQIEEKNQIVQRKNDAGYLKRGDRIAIANQAGVTVPTVSKYIDGIFQSSSVGIYFDAMVKKRKQEFALATK